MPFDPDAFLADGGVAVAEPPAFDPDAFLAQPGFDPDAFLATAQPATAAALASDSLAVAPTTSATGDFFRRIGKGISDSSMDAIGGGLKLAEDMGLPGATAARAVASFGGPDVIEGAKAVAETQRESAQDFYDPDPARDKELASTLATGIGALLPTVASGPLAPLTGAAMMGETARREATEMGGSKLQQDTAFYANAAVGALSEKLLGLPALLKSAAAKAIPAVTLRQIVNSALVQVGKGAAREGTQEGLEQLAGNLIASEVARYDPNRQAMQGVGEAALAGAILGGPLGGAVQLASDIDARTVAAQDAFTAQLETLPDKDLMAWDRQDPRAPLVEAELARRNTIAPEASKALEAATETLPPPLPTAPVAEATATTTVGPSVEGGTARSFEQAKAEAATKPSAPPQSDTATPPATAAPADQGTLSREPVGPGSFEEATPVSDASKPVGAQLREVWPGLSERDVSSALDGPFTKSIRDKYDKLPPEQKAAVDSWFDSSQSAIEKHADAKWFDDKTDQLRRFAEDKDPTQFSERLVDGLRDINSRYSMENRKSAATQFFQEAAQIAKEQGLEPAQIEAASRSEMGRIYGADAAEMSEAIFGGIKRPDAAAPDLPAPQGAPPDGSGQRPQPAASEGWKQSALPEELRTSPELESLLSGGETGPSMKRGQLDEGGAIFSAGGKRATPAITGKTPRGDKQFIRVESAPKRIFTGLLTDGAADVMAKSKNKVGQVLSRAIKKHVDIEQELHGQLASELDRGMKGMSREQGKKALAELEPYLAAKENRRPLPAISKDAQSILTAWENIAERTGLLAEAHDVQVFDPVQGQYRPMHRMGRAYVPRVFKPEVQRVLSDPRRNPQLFNDLADALAAHRKITPEEAATELRGVAGRFQSSDFMGNLEMARTGQLPEIFYDYNLGNIASRFIPSFSERMAQIISYGQRLGPRDAPLRENLWDVAMKEAEDSYSQDWLRAAEDQSANLRARSGPQKAAQQAQTAASGLLLSSPTTSVIRNTLSGLSATGEVLGIRRSIAPLIKAATDAQTKLDAREIGAVRDNLGDFLHADQLAETKLDDIIRGTTNVALKYSGYTGSEGFVRTHAAVTASQFAKDGVAAINKNPASGAAKEALAIFKRLGVDADKVVAEGADWKTGAETRKFVRSIIRDTQGGYRFDQVPLWANSATGRFFYQFGRYGTQRARNIWNNGIKPLIGEDVQWNGKTMTRRDAAPLLKMGAGAVLLGEAFAMVASGLFDRDRKDASVKEIADAFTEDEKKGALLASERIINDIIMSGTLGIFGQPVDFAKSLKDQSRFKNPANPPGLAGTKAVVNLFQDALDQDGKITKKDALAFFGSIAPGAKQLSDVARNVFDEPLYEAENDVRTLRTAATRWAAANKLDVPKRATGDFRKSANAPEYEKIYDALLVGDADRARVLASAFVASEKDGAKAMDALKSSVKGRQPFRVGPFTGGEHRSDFMNWAKSHLPKADYEQALRVQERYEAAAREAGLWGGKQFTDPALKSALRIE